MAEDFISRPRPRTWDQGQGLWYRGQGQGHCFLSSRRLEDEAKSSRTHHCMWVQRFLACPVRLLRIKMKT